MKLTCFLDADIPVRNRIATKDTKVPKRIDDLVDREVDAKGTPKPHPKSLVNKALNSEASGNAAVKKRRIVVTDDEDSEDDIPLVYLFFIIVLMFKARRPVMNGTNVSRSLLETLTFRAHQQQSGKSPQRHHPIQTMTSH